MTSGSWYRRSVWNYKGNKEYTKSGYNLAKERFNAADLDVDCSDRHYVITDCNSGIGLEIAREVAKKGGVLHMVCRNFEAMKNARSDIITNTGNDRIHLHTLDLAKPRDVLAWAKQFVSTQEKIHVLINNTDCMVLERNVDEDDIEINFAVNTLAVHIITTTFLPVLQQNEDARVITISSAGMLVVRLDPIDLMHTQMNPFDGRLVYAQNKRQQVVMTLWYAQRYDKVHFSVMHPGWADTPALRNSLPGFFEPMKDNLRTPAEGADTAVWLALSKAALKYPSGFFYQDREPASTHLPLAWTKTSIEEENLLMEKLIILTEKISGEIPKEDTESNADITVVNSHPHTNGISSHVESRETSSPVESRETLSPVESKDAPSPVEPRDTPSPVESRETPTPGEARNTPSPVESRNTPSPVESKDSSSNKVEELSVTLSAVSISKFEGTDVPDNVDNQKTEVATPVPKEPSPEKEVPTPAEVNEQVSDEKVRTPSPDSIQDMSKDPSPEKEDPTPNEVMDSVSAVVASSPQLIETKEELESEITPAVVKGEPVIEELIPAANNTESEMPQTPGEAQAPVILETSSQNESTVDETKDLETPSVKSADITPVHSPSPDGDSPRENSPIDLLDDTKQEEGDTTLKTEVKSADIRPVHSPSPDRETPRENSPVDLLNDSKQEDGDTTSKTEVSETSEAPSSVSPSPSEATYQNAAIVVEHLIDITAEKAAASISS